MTILAVYLAYALLLSVALAVAGHRSRPSDRQAVDRTRPKRVLVVGATGGTGRRLVERALARGYEVTAFVRDPAKLAVEHPRLATRAGDVLDPAAVEAAVRGQDAVLSALGHKRFLGPSRILSGGTANVLRAMERHGVGRFVCITTLGLGDSAGRLGLYYTFLVIPLVVPFYFWDKTRQERTIAASAVEWTIVRPGALVDREPRGRIRHGSAVGSFLRTVRIARADVADFMLDELETDRDVGAAVGVAW